MAPVALVVPFALLLVAGGLASCGSAASPPAKPAWLSAVPGDNTASLTWGAPQPHADVTSYVARAQPGGETCTTTGTSCTITGLKNGKSYTVTVQSVGVSGTSATTSTRVTSGVPSPPQAVTGAPGDSSIALTWEAPALSPGGPVVAYAAFSNPAGGRCVTTSTSCTVTGLANNESYVFTVYALNASGHSLPSAESSSVTPEDTAGGSPGIVYLGPVNARQETTTGTILQRDAGISVALPNDRDLWIFGDTSSFTAASAESNTFIGGSTAARGRYVPGKSPFALKDVRPAGTQTSSTTLTQFIPTPTDTYLPDGSGRPCVPVNSTSYTARWPTGATLLDAKNVLVTYSDVCVTSTTSFTVEGWGFMTYNWRNGRITTPPYDVFPPAVDGAALPPDRTYQSPVVANGEVTFFTSQCTALFIICASGTVSTTTMSSNVLVMAIPANYVARPAVTDGSTSWMPVNVSVAGYPSGLRLIEQTSIGGTFIVFSSTTPTGPWHPIYSGTLPGCSSTPTGFCYAFVGHPELGSDTSLVVSYFKPDSPENADVGHVDLALIPLTAS
jgi:hypothetical protein